MFYRLYTHNDLDGVSCAILAKLLWDKDVDVEYCNSPSEVTNRLNSDNNRQTDLIFITDCSFSYDDIKDKKLLNKIRLFDHHATALPLADKSEYYVVKVNREDGNLTCGTEIFYNYLKERRGFTYNCDWFVEQVRLYDTWDWTKGNSKTPKYLSMLLYTQSISSFCDYYVKKLKLLRLSELNVFSEKDRIILEYEEYKQQKEVDKAIKNCYITKVGDYTCGVVFGNVDMSIVGNTVCNTYDVDIALNINLSNEIMSVRTTRDDINLGKLMQKYGGGGHAKSAGAPITDSAYFSFITIFHPDKVKYFKRNGEVKCKN